MVALTLSMLRYMYFFCVVRINIFMPEKVVEFITFCPQLFILVVLVLLVYLPGQ